MSEVEVIPSGNLVLEPLSVGLQQIFEGCDDQDNEIVKQSLSKMLSQGAIQFKSNLDREKRELLDDFQRVTEIESDLLVDVKSLENEKNKIRQAKAELERASDVAGREKLMSEKREKDIELRDLKEAAKGQHESMSKEVKSIDKKNLAKIKKFMEVNSSDKTIGFILDNFSKFMCASKTATYTQAEKFFVDVETFYDKIREIKVGALDHKDIQEIILKIQGNNGQGEIIKQLTDESKVKEYVEFFCYAKTLLKLCNWQITACRVKQHEKKISNIDKQVANFAAQAERNNAIAGSLNETPIDDLISYLKSSTGSRIADKKDRIQKALEKVNNEIENFAQIYFEDMR